MMSSTDFGFFQYTAGMRLGMIGLGKMGCNMVKRLVRGGHEVAIWNRSREKTDEVAKEGATPTYTVKDLVASLEAPRRAWVMVPSGDATEAMIDELIPLLAKGDTIVDGGNSNFHDTIRRHEKLAGHGIHFVDAGTSGGVWGLENGYCMMVGGPDEAIARLTPALDTLAPAEGWLHTGDLALREANGYFRITGRLKDLVIRGGENVSAGEIEELLVRMVRVAEVAFEAVSVPAADRLGEPGKAWDALARALCDRHEGLGADGLILYSREPSSTRPHARMRLLNADGSRAEVSGNGVRALGALLRSQDQEVEDRRHRGEDQDDLRVHVTPIRIRGAGARRRGDRGDARQARGVCEGGRGI